MTLLLTAIQAASAAGEGLTMWLSPVQTIVFYSGGKGIRMADCTAVTLSDTPADASLVIRFRNGEEDYVEVASGTASGKHAQAGYCNSANINSRYSLK